jgi:hypothetical protein
MPPCSHIPPAGFFQASLLTDNEVFSRWVARQWPLIPVNRTSHLTSALHIDLKLWHSATPLARIFIENDARGNAWKVARPQSAKDPFTLAPNAKNQIWNSITSVLPHAAAACAMFVYDEWILKKIMGIRASALAVPHAHGLVGNNTPSMLTTVGMSQKLINIFIKYHVCWHAVGQFNQGAANAAPYPTSGFVAPFICAYHSPIDRILINNLKPLSIGKEWIKRGLLDRADARLKDSTGTFRPWSKMDCLRTYYGFQLMLRKVAMVTWPRGCACRGDLIAVCAKRFDEWFPDQENSDGPDWIQAALDLPDDVFAQTALEIGSFVNRGAERIEAQAQKISRVQFEVSKNPSRPVARRNKIQPVSREATTIRKTVRKTFAAQSFQPGTEIETAFAQANRIAVDPKGHVPNQTAVTLILGAQSFSCKWSSHGSIRGYDRGWFRRLGEGHAILCSFDALRNAVIVDSIAN